VRAKARYQMDIEERHRRQEMHSSCPNGGTCNYCLKTGVCIEDTEHIDATKMSERFNPPTTRRG
jgi:hypothetical protein